MGKWLDIKGPVVADTVYADNTLVAKDVASPFRASNL